MSLFAESMLLLTAAVAAPNPADVPKSEFFELYAVTCLANVFTPDKLRETLSTSLTPEIPKERAAPFLAGRTGRAWRVFFGKGQYAVALIDSNVCAVFAPQAPIQTVTKDFSNFAAHPPSSLTARQLPAAEAGPNTSDLTSTAFVWQQPQKPLAILYILTTSKAALDPQIQAMASVTVGRPEP